MIKLTDEQEKAVEIIQNFLEGDEEEMVFIGPAGAGKTFTLKYALKDYAHGSVAVGATISHAAKNVLQESVGDIMKCHTIAQLLNLKPVNSIGKQKFVQVNSELGGKKSTPIKFAKVIVIDECSMVDDQMRTMIYNNAEKDAKIIYTGDNRQLPPVENDDKDSSIFDLETVAELTISRRFSGPIGEVAVFYRSYIDYAKTVSERMLDMGNFFSFRPQILDSESSVYFTSDKTLFDQKATDYFFYYPEDTRILAYRNDTINHYNEFMRDVFKGENSELFTVGERIILNSPYRCRAHKEDKERDFFFHNGEVLEIKDVILEDKFITTVEPLNGDHDYKVVAHKNRSFKCYALYVEDSEGNPRVLYSVHPSSMRLYNTSLNFFKEQALKTSNKWKEYYAFRDEFIDYSYLYCQSSHKAQGQSIDHVFVLADDILKVSGTTWVTKLKSLYVAATRARKTLFVMMS